MPGASRIRFVDEGTAEHPVVVLSNSLGTTTEMWDLQAPSLLRRYRVIRYDHRGHGAGPSEPSPILIEDLAEDLLALLDELGVEDAHLLGLSVGGMIAIQLAASAPERVRSLVLASTSADLAAPGFWTDRATTVRGSGLKSIAETVVGRWFTSDYAARQPERIAWASAMLTSTDPSSYARYAEMLATTNLTPLLAQVHAPTLVLAGADDTAILPTHGERLADAIHGATLSILPRAAHLANVEQAAGFTDLAMRHMASVDRVGM